MNTIQINFDALKRESWTTAETQNAKTLVSFVQTLMNNHDFDRAEIEFGNPLYTQHNRSIPDGFDGLITYVKGLVKRFPDYAYDVKRIHVDGDHVIFHSHITTNKKDRGNESKGFNASDTWRVENNQIADHWDSLQPMDAGARFLWLMIGGKEANSNPVYS